MINNITKMKKNLLQKLRCKKKIQFYFSNLGTNLKFILFDFGIVCKYTCMWNK